MKEQLQPISKSLQRGLQSEDSQVWQRIETFTDPDGNAVQFTNVAYVEMQSGMHYREDGEWKESQALIGFEGADSFGFTANVCGFGSPMAVVRIRVVAPPVLTAVCRPDRILLRWAILPGVESAITDFRIKRATSSGGPYTVIGTVTANSRSFEDTSPGLMNCYVVTMRRLDPCTGVFFESPPSSEICIAPCSEPPCEEPTITGWLFTDRGIIGPMGTLPGGNRVYSDPSAVVASPWSFESPDQHSLRMSFENDGNCANFNHNTQIGTAEGIIVLSCARKMTVAWSGVGEPEDGGFELMSLLVNGDLVGSAKSPGGSLGCAPMLPVISDPPPPQVKVLQPGIHILRIETTTDDEFFHVGAFYQFDLTFDPL